MINMSPIKGRTIRELMGGGGAGEEQKNMRARDN